MNRLCRTFSFLIALVLLSLNYQPAAWAAPARVNFSEKSSSLAQPGSSLAAQDTGIDCGCEKTGPFAKPAKGVNPEVDADGTSPKDVYKVKTSGTGPINFSIVRLSDGMPVLSFGGQTGLWGFSPDDQRFVYWESSAGVATVYLYNLKATANKLVFMTSRAASEMQILFSSSGRYFFLVTLTGTNYTHLQVIDSLTGNERFTTQFNFGVIPGEEGDHYGMANYGFSPDSANRTFVYSYANTQNNVLWGIVNLKSGAQLVNQPISAISAFWQFSKCGDRLGMIQQPSANQLTTALYQTQNVSLVAGSQKNSPFGAATLNTTATQHVATIAAAPYVLGSNTAAAVCPGGPELDSLSLYQPTLVGGEGLRGFVTLTEPAPAGGALVSISSDHPGLVGPGNATLPEGYTTRDFTGWTQAVSVPTDVVITGSYNGASASVTLHLIPPPPALASITPGKTVLESGEILSVTVALEKAAPEGGTAVALTSTRPDLLSLPPVLTIQSGHTSAAVSTIAQRQPNEAPVILGASLGEVTKTAEVLVRPRPVKIDRIQISPASVTGGDISSVTIVLTDFVFGSTPVALSSSNQEAAPVQSPLTVSAGGSQADFRIYTTGVAETVNATITAALDASTKEVVLEIKPAELKGFAFAGDCEIALSDTSQKGIAAGSPLDLMILLDGLAPPAGAEVALQSSRPDLLPVPAAVKIEERSTWLALQTAQVTQPTPVTITAAYRQKSITLQVNLIQIPKYTLTVLPFAAEGMNEAGQIAGEDYLLQDGVLINMEDALKTDLYIRDINENGDLLLEGVVNGEYGYYYYADQQFQPIDTPEDYEYTTLGRRALNNQGEVVGNACTDVPDHHCVPFEWKNGVSTVLPVDNPSGYMTAMDSNSSGTIVGYSRWVDSVSGFASARALRWTDLLYDPFGLTPQSYSQAWVINDAGTVGLTFASYIVESDKGVYKWKDGVLTRVPLPANAQYDSIEAINENDDLLIWASVNTGEELIPEYPFLSTSYGTYRLSCAVDLAPDESIDWPIDITNKGEILILANVPGRKPSGFTTVVLSPPGVIPPKLPGSQSTVYIPFVQK